MKKTMKKIPVLERLAREMQVLSETEQRRYIGGGNGSPDNPYTLAEYFSLQSGGCWYGGYVVGQGYTDANGYWGGSGSGNNYGSSGYDSNSGSGDGGNLTDGVDIANSQHFTFNTQSNQVFDQTLKSILQSNSVLKNILHYFDKGYVHMTFGVKDISDPNTGADTERVSNESYHITFSRNAINNGMNHSYNGFDNIGFDWSKVHTPEEALVVVLAHEALHAKHFSIFDEIYAKYVGKKDGMNHAAKEMLKRGFSKDLVNCFFNQPNSNIEFWNELKTEEQIEKSLHDYMRIYNLGVIQAALDEYRADHMAAGNNGSSGSGSGYNDNGSSGSGDRGSQSNPYTPNEFYNWPGVWPGGYVEGMGFVPADNTSSGGSSGSGNYGPGSGGDYWSEHGFWTIDELGNWHWQRTS